MLAGTWWTKVSAELVMAMVSVASAPSQDKPTDRELSYISPQLNPDAAADKTFS